ncbi:MAG: hypothetical protein K5769_08840 [Pseudobutyrivibrio sp.]|nr:hypothetical protein [Pseudobutyrivibrio sp.]
MEFIRDAIESLLIGAFEQFDALVGKASAVLTGGESGFEVDTVWSDMQSISDTYLKPFCMTIIGICLLIELAQVASKVDVIKWEHGLKIMVKMCLAKVFVDTAPKFLKACYQQASSWISSIGTTNIRIGTSLTERISDQCAKIDGFWAPLGAMMTLNIPCLIIRMCGLIVAVIAFGRMFEMYCLLAISPLPCAFFPLGDGSGGGFSRITKKFLLNFIGVCLHGVMIMICIKVFGSIMTSIVNEELASGGDALTNINNICYQLILGGIVLVMACAKSGQWAKSVLDAG